MLRYKDLPDPPCNDIVTAVEEVKRWLADPVNNKEPDSNKVSLVYNIAGDAKKIRESLEKRIQSVLQTGKRERLTVTSGDSDR